jgi:archaellum component FlaF (FlaF/FlaG flagellin family)
MARIQLRDTTIYLQDGLAGTSQVDIGNSCLTVPAVTRTTEGDVSTDEIQVIAQYIRAASGGTYTLTFDDGVAAECPLTTGIIGFDDDAAAIQTIVDTAMTTYLSSSYTPGDITVTDSGATGLDDGTVTLTFDGTVVDDKAWLATIIDGAALTGATGSVGLNVGVQTTVINADNTDLIPVGARFTVVGESGTPVHTVTDRDNTSDDAATLRVAFTPVLASVVSESDVINFLPQRLQIAIGDGDLNWTEGREMIYDLDRDVLDTVRQGQDQPLEVDLAFTFEYVTTESGQAITPVDAIKRIGEATEWVSSSSDLCEPYSVDLYVLDCVPCGTDEDQDFLFPDFRYESLEYSIRDASIAVSGRCNVTDVVTTRADFVECA